LDKATENSNKMRHLREQLEEAKGRRDRDDDESDGDDELDDEYEDYFE
jgi:hypothetical protein